jgi:hypothetical protein
MANLYENITKLNPIVIIVLFAIGSFINVALNTFKTIIMHKEKKLSSSIINAITYGFYTIIVLFTAIPLFLNDGIDLIAKILITVITNFIGVWVSMVILEKFKKDSLWEITATIDREYIEEIREYLNLCEIAHNYNLVDNYKNSKVIFRIYSENQKQSEETKYILDKCKAKYIVHEERVKL